MKLCKCVGVLCGVAAGVGVMVAGGFLAGQPALAQPQGQPIATPMKVATVDVLKIVERYIAKPELANPRTDLLKKWEAQGNAAQAELQALEAQARGLPPGDPKLQEMGAQYQAKQQALQQLSQQANSEIDVLVSQHMVQAYDAIRSSAQAAATRGGYTLIFMSRAAAEPIKPDDRNMVIQQILARPIISSSGADDLTEAIIAEMKLPPLPLPEPMAPATPPTSTPPAPPGQK